MIDWEDWEYIICILAGITIGIAIAFGITIVSGAKAQSYWHKKIIEHDCGYYNPTTAEFEWVHEEIK